MVTAKGNQPRELGEARCSRTAVKEFLMASLNLLDRILIIIRRQHNITTVSNLDFLEGVDIHWHVVAAIQC